MTDDITNEIQVDPSTNDLTCCGRVILWDRGWLVGDLGGLKSGTEYYVYRCKKCGATLTEYPGQEQAHD